MAITLQQQPTTLQPAHNPLEYLVTSNNTGQANFKLIVHIHYDVNVSNTKIATLAYDVIPSTTQFITDVARIYSSKVTERNPATLIAGSATSYTVLPDNKIAFQEYYGSEPTLQGSVVSGAAFSVWNAAFRYNEIASGTWANYKTESTSFIKPVLTPFVNTTSDASYLSIFPTITPAMKYRKVRYDADNMLRYVRRGVSGSKGFAVMAYDENYAPLSVGLYSPITTLVDAVTADINLKPSVLNTWTSVFDAGRTPTPFTFTSAAKYFAVFASTLYNRQSLAYLFEIDWSPCEKYTKFELCWLNRYGGWDTVSFDLVSRKQTNVERLFMKNDATRRISGTTLINDVYARRKQQYQTNVTERYTVSSQLLKDFESDGLADLFTSPLVFWNDSGSYRAVNIVGDTYDHLKSVTDKAFSVQFTFEVDQNNIAQRL